MIEIDESVTSHSVPLSALQDNTTYYYNVSSCDPLGNCATDGTYSFTTLESNLPPVLTGIPDQNVDEDTAPAPNWIDLWTYASDSHNSSDELIYSFVSETNPSLITCLIDVNQYIDCQTPAANQSGTSDITIRVSDGEFTDTDTFTVTVNPIDDSAYWNTLSNQNVNEDAAATNIYPNLRLQCTDIDNSTVVAITSTHTHYDLVFVANDLYISNLELNWNGLETVNLDCNGVPASFDITVNAVNDAPTIEGIPNQNLVEDTGDNQDLLNLEAYASDPETAASALTYTLVSETATSIVDCSIDGSNNLDCTVQAGQVGTSFVTVEASDGSIADNDTFAVSVGNVNDPPTWSTLIPDQNVDEDTTPPINWVDLYTYASDPDNASTELTFTITLETNSSLIDCFITANRYVNCNTPAGNQYGFSDITVNVTDGQYADLDTFRVTVNPVNDAPTVPVQTFPPDGETTKGKYPTFMWLDSTDPDNDPLVYDFDLNGTIITGLGSLQYTPGSPLSNGNYTWRVRANDTVLASSWSGYRTLTVSIPGNITGNVVDELAAPVAGATVEAKQGASVIGTTTTAGDGSYNLMSLPRGTYTVLVYKTGYVDNETSGIVVNSDQVTSHDATLNAIVTTGDLNGTVSDANNNIYGATVELYQGASLVASTTTAADGSYEFLGIDAGTYDVQVTKPGFNNYVESSFALGAGVMNELDATLSQNSAIAGGVSGTVYDLGDFSTIAGAQIVVYKYSTMDIVQIVYSASDGTYIVNGLPATSTYDLEASAAGFTTQTFAVNLGIGPGTVNTNNDAFLS
jgi:hypothetical protein